MTQFGAEMVLRLLLPVENQEEAITACMELTERATKLLGNKVVLVEVKGFEIMEGDESGDKTDVQFWNFSG